MVTPNDVANRITVLMTEYSASRNEILQLSNKQQALLISSFTVTGFAFTFLNFNFVRLDRVLIEPHTWFALSVVLSALGLLYGDYDRAIIRCATYNEGFLKVEITRLLIGPKSSVLKERQSFNTNVTQPHDIPYELHSAEDIQQIINDGLQRPFNRSAADCRLLEWESYIRGRKHLIHHLDNFEKPPHTASIHGSLIVVPALVCWFGLWASLFQIHDWAAIRLVIPILFMIEVVGAMFFWLYVAYRLYIVVGTQKLSFPPGHPHRS